MNLIKSVHLITEIMRKIYIEFDQTFTPKSLHPFISEGGGERDKSG